MVEQDGSAFIIAHLTTGQVKGCRLAGSMTHSMEFCIQAAFCASDTAGKAAFFSRLAAVLCALRWSGVNHQSACGTIVLNKLSENLVKDPQPAPADKALARRLAWPVPGRGVFPLRAVPDDMHDPADDAPVITPRNTMRPGKAALDAGNPGARKIKKFLYCPLLEPAMRTF